MKRKLKVEKTLRDMTYEERGEVFASRAWSHGWAITQALHSQITRLKEEIGKAEKQIDAHPGLEGLVFECRRHLAEYEKALEALGPLYRGY